MKASSGGSARRTQAAGGTAKLLLIATAASLLPGCVRVAAPEKPIEINLNITIRQEVLVRLQQDARELVEENPDVF
jgi:hypothetical protein